MCGTICACSHTVACRSRCAATCYTICARALLPAASYPAHTLRVRMPTSTASCTIGKSARTCWDMGMWCCMAEHGQSQPIIAMTQGRPSSHPHHARTCALLTLAPCSPRLSCAIAPNSLRLHPLSRSLLLALALSLFVPSLSALRPCVYSPCSRLDLSALNLVFPACSCTLAVLARALALCVSVHGLALCTRVHALAVHIAPTLSLFSL
jgi:hypothetical protein